MILCYLSPHYLIIVAASTIGYFILFIGGLLSAMGRHLPPASALIGIAGFV